MGVSKPRQPRHIFVDPGIILHGAATQGIDPVVHSVVHPRKSRIVSHDFDLGDLGKLRVFFADEFSGDELREISFWDVAWGKSQSGAAFGADVKDRRSHIMLLSRS
jgi:hypothetical protein